MRKIGEMRIWWLWRKFVEMASVLQKTQKPTAHAAETLLALGQSSDAPRLEVIESFDVPKGSPGQEQNALIVATTRRGGGALPRPILPLYRSICNAILGFMQG